MKEDLVQANSGAVASVGEVNVRSEWLPYDSAPETLEHIRQVAKRLDMVRLELGDRAYWHDVSKLGFEEKPLFDEMTPKLKTLVYGTEEYKASLAALGPALTHHYENNSHHPEHYPNGIAGFDLLDLIEMYCDWAAASLRNKDGDMGNSLEINFKRFGISDQLASIIRNTWIRHSGFAGYENFSVGWKKETDDPCVTECRDWGTGQNFVRKPKTNLPYPPDSDGRVTSPNEAEHGAVSLNQNCNAYGSTDALRSALAKLADAVDRERRTHENYRRLFDAENPIAADKVIARAIDVYDVAFASTNEAAIEARAALSGSPAPSTEGLRELASEARFLLNRLSELSFDDLDDHTRDFNGHVEPSISRLGKILDAIESRTALAGVTAPQPNIEELIVAAYKRGFQWCVENTSDPEAAAYVGKAARDYADYTMNAPSAGVTAPSEVDGK